MRRFCQFELDSEVGILRGPEGEIRLRPKTFALLQVLVDAAPALVSKDDLLNRIWGEAHLGETSLAQAVSELRRVLEDTPKTPRFIETVHRRGYRFIASVEEGVRSMATESVTLPDPAAPNVSSENLGSHRKGLLRPGLWVPITLALLMGSWLVGSWLDKKTLDSEALDLPSERVVDEVPFLRIAVIPPEVPSGVPEWIPEAIGELIGGHLRGHSEIYVYRPQDIEAMVRDIDSLGVSSAEIRQQQLRYLQADGLIVGDIQPLEGRRWSAELQLIDRQGVSNSLGPPSEFLLSELKPHLTRWTTQSLRSLGLRVDNTRSLRNTHRIDLGLLELYFDARRMAVEDSAAALALLDRAQQRKPRAPRLAQARAERLLGMGKKDAAHRVARQVHNWRVGIEEDIWFLNFMDRPQHALALLEQGVGEPQPFVELWLQTLSALARSPNPDHPIAALSVLERLPEDVSASWLAPELQLLEAQTAWALGETDRARRAAAEARVKAEALGHRLTAQQAKELLLDFE